MNHISTIIQSTSICVMGLAVKVEFRRFVPPCFNFQGCGQTVLHVLLYDLPFDGII